jgi:hypothetical protein
MEFVQTFDNQVNSTLTQFVRKPTLVRGAVHLLLVLYAARLAPSLPAEVLALFENGYFKMFVFSLILWTAQFSPSTSIMIAIAFMVTVNHMNKKPLFEFLENTEDPTATPVAPTQNLAVDVAQATVASQLQDSATVNAVAQKQETIVVQPSIVETSAGPTIVNPSVVVAPAVVTTPSGEQVAVQPQVTYVDVPQQQVPAAAQEGCFPVRRIDMSKVAAFESGSYSAI